MAGIIMVVILIFGAYKSWNFLSGRSAWLDQDGVVNKICKLAISIAISYIVVGFLFVLMVLKVLGMVSRD